MELIFLILGLVIVLFAFTLVFIDQDKKMNKKKITQMRNYTKKRKIMLK